MITADHVRLMAEYNQWMNRRLYDPCEPMVDAARKLDRGASTSGFWLSVQPLLWAYVPTGPGYSRRSPRASRSCSL